MDRLFSRNPATGETLGELPVTDPQTLSEIFRRARLAQRDWAALSVKSRARYLLSVREALLNQLDEVVEVIHRENGKPKFEALSNEIFPVADLLTYYSKQAARVLVDREIPLRLMRHRRSTLNYWPLGTVVVISPWNYPFLLPFGEIAMALVAGNAVVFKPSEITPLVGLKIQEICERGGLPSGLLQTVIGDGKLGAALISEKPNKVFFTGSVSTGKKVMAAAAEHLIPVNLELGGKDPMIVLADANLDFATSAALWGGFSNSGQVCASVERILIHESIKDRFVEMLRKKLSALRQDLDLGVITFEKQKLVYEKQIKDAQERGLSFAVGGTFNESRTRLEPTLVLGDRIESSEVYREESFGPIKALASFRTVDEAIELANGTRYGLLASIITGDVRLAMSIARKLHAGTVTINEVTYTAGISETPWGGVKESGMGRSHGDFPLYEFVNVRHIHAPRPWFPAFKSLWWFPYSPSQFALFRSALDLYRQNWISKVRALPLMLWNFVRMIKTERRL